MNEQARRSSPPNRVRSPTDQQFASGCSPPRLTTTQLPSATEFVAYSGTDFHRADVAPSRAHSFRRKPESRFAGRSGTLASVKLAGVTKVRMIGVGDGFRRPRPPNRACGFPAHGSPVGGFLIGIGSLTAKLKPW
jgi:hypothetical protein